MELWKAVAFLARGFGRVATAPWRVRWVRFRSLSETNGLAFVALVSLAALTV